MLYACILFSPFAVLADDRPSLNGMSGQFCSGSNGGVGALSARPFKSLPHLTLTLGITPKRSERKAQAESESAPSP